MVSFFTQTGIGPELEPKLLPPEKGIDTSIPAIAYAVTVTSCQKTLLVDGAAVLQHSIYLASKKSRYQNFKLYAFLHPDAIPCRMVFDRLGYTVLVKHVPFDIGQIRGPYKKLVNTTGCCGEKEWLKLYSLTLYDHPIVFHFDLDCYVLEPLDELVDTMLFGGHPKNLTRHFMWHYSTKSLPTKPQAFFTRDYGMIASAGQKRVDQIGMQGGFWVVRPSQEVFEEMVELLLDGNFTGARGWGQMGYGQYYGAATIQGFAAYYYAQARPGSSVELNRCIYNNMVDSPYAEKNHKCLTLEKNCQDCRDIGVNEIKTVHMTRCFKPWHCVAGNHVKWVDEKTRDLCLKLHYEWYRIRYLMETTGSDDNRAVQERRNDSHLIPFHERTFGYCAGWPPKYSIINYSRLFTKS